MKTLNQISHFFQARLRTDYIFVAIALLLMLGLAFWNIAGPSIWFDEAFGAYLIHFNFLDIAKYTATDVHPPMFYWFLKIWTAIFGNTELGLRSMSVFFAAVAAVFGYLLTRRLFGRRAAITGIFILALSPLFIRYSQEARMYTMATAIVLSATYVMVRALEAKVKGRKLWVLYGVLVSLGMWTHYFTVLAWLAHWVWRYITIRSAGVRRKELRQKFFSKNWLTAYIIAVALYLPWLPAMATQLVVVQSEGFWIRPVGVDAVSGYFGTLVFFLEHDHVTGWLSAALVAMGVVTTVLAVRSYRSGNETFKRNYLLLLCLSAVSPILLFIASLPPLTSSFVERYVLPAAAASAFFMGVTLVYGLAKTKIWKQLVIYAVILTMLIFGISQMYYYGNYNKNSRTDIKTKQLVQQVIEKSEVGEPIIVASPWVFYEAVFYNSTEHPIYFIDADTSYDFGSLDMLKYSDEHKIKDLDAFTKVHPVIWYIGYFEGDVIPPKDSWKPIDTASETSQIDGKTVYKGVEYTIPKN
ncbi:glycosyltransferase family 39 protein [Candidatus Saccharibacteria bacterium]|nr:glycosyltransferase family 39 protein [Candidatus Saccharibacteria bacterium]